jgi:hypothetical protein
MAITWQRPVARRQPLDVLDQQWFDGRTNAQCVLPHIAADSEVLEIACGIGRISRFIAPHLRRLHCADILTKPSRKLNQLGEFHNISLIS